MYVWKDTESFFQNRLNNSFIRESHVRNVEIFPVNFNSVDEAGFIINNWISNATKNQISTLYKADAIRGVKLLLANTIYFRGEWKHAFNETIAAPFETTERLIKSVPTMKNTLTLRSGDIVLRNGFTGRWVEIPYAGNDYSMVVILPLQKHHLDVFIHSMRSSDFIEILKQLDSSYKKLVHLSLPKFSVQSTFSLVNTLLKVYIVIIMCSIFFK